MSYNFLQSVFLTSCCTIGAIAPVIAQERPKCYLIDQLGQLTNLTDICNATQPGEGTPESTADEGLKIVNNNKNIVGTEPLAGGISVDDNVYFLGEDSVPVNLSPINSSYYIDNEIGNDFTAYIRRYQVSPTSIPRQSVRERVFQFDVDFEPNNLTSILRRGQGKTPFIIYRYPVR